MSAAPRSRRKAGVLFAGLIGSALAVLCIAQASPGQEQNQGNQGGNQGQGQSGDGVGRRGGRNFDPEQFRQQISQRMKERLGASDEEWTVLSPKIDKVMTAQRQASTGGRGMGMLFGGGRGGRSGRGPGGDGGNRGDRRGRGGPFGGNEESPVAVKARELQQSIENNAGADELKAKLAALREARTKAREQLTAAQNELKELLTAKQEAALVVMGMLE